MATNTEVQKQLESKIGQFASQSYRAESNGDPVSVSINEAELNSLLTSALISQGDGSELTNAIKGINTAIGDGKIESGVVFDLSDLPTENLSRREEAAIATALKAFPLLKDRPIYIGIEGKPTIANGRIQLDDNIKVKVGKLSMTLPELSQRFGIPLSKLENRLNEQLLLSGLDISEVDLTGQELRLHGTVSDFSQ